MCTNKSLMLNFYCCIAILKPFRCAQKKLADISLKIVSTKFVINIKYNIYVKT